MTDRELRLRQRIDTLSDERRALRRSLRRARRKIERLEHSPVSSCVYCGHWCRGKTCVEHRNLAQIEAAVC